MSHDIEKLARDLFKVAEKQVILRCQLDVSDPERVSLKLLVICVGPSDSGFGCTDLAIIGFERVPNYRRFVHFGPRSLRYGLPWTTEILLTHASTASASALLALSLRDFILGRLESDPMEWWRESKTFAGVLYGPTTSYVPSGALILSPAHPMLSRYWGQFEMLLHLEAAPGNRFLPLITLIHERMEGFFSKVFGLHQKIYFPNK